MLTAQRKAILGVLEDASRPLTREEILTLGRRKITSLGPATVDRAIKHLTENHRIIGVQFPGQPRRYELPATHEHPHFVCRSCDQVYDLPVTMRLPVVEAPAGFHVTGGEIIYSGTCPECSLNQSERA